MKLYNIFRRPHPDPVPDPLVSIRAAYAYACLDCHRITEGANNLHCLCCGSQAIFHVLTLLNATKNRAAQRLKLQETIKAAKARGARNDLAFLTAPEPPHDAA